MRSVATFVRLLLLAILFPAASSLAQTAPDLNCADSANRVRCDALRAEEHHRIYGQPTIERLQADGVQVRRVFIHAAYGEFVDRDLIAILFSRAPGHSPMVIVQLARSADGRLPEPLAAEVPLAVWREVLERSETFDRDMTPPPPGAPEYVCFWGWAYTVEAGDPASADEPGKVRRRTANTCGDEQSLAIPYARFLGEAAIALFPACALLDPAHNALAAARLAECAGFGGDRMAAAEADNDLDPLFGVAHADDVGLARRHFAEDAVLDWAGEHVEGSAAVAARWVRGITAHEVRRYDDLHLQGETRDRVRVTFTLTFTTPRATNGFDRRRALFALLLTREDDDDRFTVKEARVGRFEPVPVPPAPHGE